MKMEGNRLGELVEKAKQGDPAAFEELYSISCKKVYFTCISFLRNEEDAKDVMQNVYITAYEKLTSLNDVEKFIPWINKIAVNKCKKLLMRRTAVFTDAEKVGNELTEENENFLPEEYITQKEKRKLVMDIMRNTLSDIQYKTVILYYFNGLLIDEIADIMECPPGTVKYRLSVARAKIRDGVDAYENRSGEKLYSVVGLPLLMRLLYEEAESRAVPDMLQEIMEAVRGHLAAGAVESAAAVGKTVGTTESTAAAGEAAGTIESGTAAGEAVQNTISGIANSIKGGTMKAGMNTLIAKIGIAVAIVAVIAVGAVFLIRNSGEEEASGRGRRDDAQEQTSGSDDAQGQTSGHGSEGDAQDQVSGSGAGDDTQGQVVEFSGDWDMIEESGYPPFWFKYANLGMLEEMDFSNLMFYDKFAFGTSLEEMISSYNNFSIHEYCSPNDSGFITYVPALNSLEEFKEWANTNTIGAGYYNSLDIWCYTEEDNYSDQMKVQIYNLTDSEVTIWECIENGQFKYDANAAHGDAFAVFGVPYNSGNLADNREALTELMEILGKPSMVANCRNSQLSYVDREEDEEFSETVSLGGGTISYRLVYDRGDYILQIPVVEIAVGGSYSSTTCIVTYLTKDVYEYIQEKYPDSLEIIQDVYDFE
ncbi:MAG: sigma-70 family RNA polymerase sigma factor [Lachnospiraceae bacterium]|nr:sigma-70 family RNA polymerase sigma factor [Lachnospiraceae bacterium]